MRIKNRGQGIENRGNRAAAMGALLLLILVLVCGNASAAISSDASGNWSSPGTWTPATVPTASDQVIINAGHTVTVDINTATASTMTVEGRLSFSRIQSSSLTLVGGDLTVNSGGWLDMGYSAMPISAAYQAKLVLAAGTTAGQFGLIVNTGGKFTSYGASKAPAAIALAGVSAGNTTISVNTTGLNWSVGDTIVIGTEAVTIVSMAAGSIDFSPALTASYPNSDFPLSIGNLTRNVVVTSSGTNPAADVSYLISYVTNPVDFVAFSTEFKDLGTGMTGKQGLTISGAGSRADISSSTFRGGDDGLQLDNADGCLINGNVFYDQQSSGIELLPNSDNNRLINNHFFSHPDGAILLQASDFNQILGNVMQHHGFYGIGLTNQAANYSDNNTVRDNDIYAGEGGIGLFGAGDNLVSSNTIRVMTQDGLHLETAVRNIVTSNDITKVTDGIKLISGNQNGFWNNAVYGNSGYGFYSDGGQTIDWVGGKLGYTPIETASANALAEISFGNSSSSRLTLHGAKINPASGIDSSGLSIPDSWITSFNQNGSNGNIRFQGYRKISGETLTVAASSPTYGSFAFYPIATQGIHTASIDTTEDLTATTQWITIVYTGAVWNVSGSISGFMRSFMGTQSGLPIPSANPQFYLSFTPGTPQANDRVEFLLVGASSDPGIGKKMTFGPVAPSLNNGRSKITIDPTGSFELSGTMSNPSVMGGLDAGSTYYSFVDSGTFIVRYASITNMDEQGIWLSGSGPFAIEHSTFDFSGTGQSSTSTLITLMDVTESTITLDNVTYRNSRLNDANYNFTILGSSVGLSWTHYIANGSLAGDANERFDTANLIQWSAGLPPPSGLTGVSNAVTSIQWSWNLSPSATGYTLYYATSPTIVATDLAALIYMENSLVSNSSHSRVVTAWSGGTETGPSSSKTVYTLANTPAVAMTPVSDVGSSSFTVKWSTSSNPDHTPYEISMALDSSFTVGLSTPVTFAAALTANTTTLTNLSPLTTYYVRVRARNGDGIPTNFLTIASTRTLSPGGISAGEGAATLVPASLAEGAMVQTATMTFIVPSGNYFPGGGVQVQLPFGWGPYLQTTSPGMPGHVAAASNPSRTLALTPSMSDASVAVTLDSGQTLAAGATIQVFISRLWSPCPLPGQSTVYWTVSSRSAGGASFQNIVTQPAQSIIVSTAASISFTPQEPLSVVSGLASSTITVTGRSSCWSIAPVAGSVVMDLSGLLPDYITTDPNAEFSATSDFSALITSVTLSTGATQSSFFYRTNTVGTNLSIRASYLDIQFGHPTSVSRQVHVFSSAVTFSDASLDSGMAGSGTSTFTLTPNNDGENDYVFIRFTPSDDDISWRVRISSDNFVTRVYERWGTGDPFGTMQWDGRNMFGPSGSAIVPNGVYQVRMEVPGMPPDTSLSITVSGASISGKVRLGATPMANVWVNANATSGYGFGGAMTDGNGNYSINGLTSGQAYHLQVSFYDPNTMSAVSGSLFNITAPSATADITVSRPAKIRVAATLSQAAPFQLFGQVNAYTADYSQNYWSSIRFQMSSTTSDNGDYFNPSTWTIIAAQPGSYTVRLHMPSFPPMQQTVTVSAGETVDVPVFNLTRPANVFGLITLPAATDHSMWVPVEGILSGQTSPMVWGGAYFEIGQSTAIFQVYNVPAGNYSFKIRAQGYLPVVVSTTVTGSDIGDFINGGLDIPSTSFSTGGKISGTITVQGDTSASPSLSLWINAYSPSLGSGEFAQVTLATSATSTSGSYQIGGLADGTYQVYPPYVSGFELTPPGPKSATVTGGVGTLNLLLTENTGQIGGSITLPGGSVDYNQVFISVNGPMISTSVAAAGATYALPRLGSGFFDVTAVYGTTGAHMRRSIAVVNGQTSTLELDLSAPTYVISGSVTIQSPFTVTPTSGTPVTINTISELLSNATTQYFYINGIPVIVPTARVEAFPKQFHSYGGASRRGFDSSFFGADIKYGAIQADGSYVIPGITPGLWEVSVFPYLDGGTVPSMAVTRQTLTITAGNKTDIDFGLTAGNSVGGTISLPGGATDHRTFEVIIVTDRGDYVQSSSLQIGSAGSPASSVAYLFKNLPSGNYALIIRDPGTWDPSLMQMTRKYSAKPATFEIDGADIPALNITLARASRIIGKLSILGKTPDGEPVSTLVTPNNITVLPNNFRIAAMANPWVEGGYQEASMSTSSTGFHVDINASNQFHIDGLVPGTYDVQFRQDSFGAAFVGEGSVSLASYVKGQLIVTEGQVTDLGTIELKQGLSLTGTVEDTSGNALPNIRVRARPSGKHDYSNEAETFTDTAGQFTLSGINPDLKSYDIIAAPRPWIGDTTPPSAYGQVIKKAVDVTQTPLPTVAFTLEGANASLSGQVLTMDSGPLGYPDGDKEQGYPAAAIYLQKQGVPTAGDNPLGDIQAASNLDGSFSITSLVPGRYDVQVVSLNYKPHKFAFTIEAGSNNAGTITLQVGAILNTTLQKTDGSDVSSEDVEFAVAVTADLGTIIFGQISKDEHTRTIRSIRFSGFDSTKRYSVLLFDNRDNITSPNEGRNLAFSSDSEEKNLTLTYQPSAPTAYVQVKKVGSAVEATFYLSRALRNVLPADNDMASLLTVTAGNGALSSFAIGGDRRTMSVLYTPPAEEQTATLRLSGSAVDIDPSTGNEFPITKSVILRFGQRASAEQNINPVLGGEVTLAESAGDPSGVDLPANALLDEEGAAVDADASYGISFTATEDAADLPAQAPGMRAGRGARAAALGVQLARGEAAYVPEAYQAMKAAHASATINPLSSFYSVLLPAGLSHTLNQSATLTLQYDTGADPSAINIYYFDGSKYLIENANRTIDAVNRTITVNVSHFSTFVVLQNSLPVVITDGDSGSAADIKVFNFPNPFDLTAKTKTLNHGGSTSTMDTTGTIVRYLLPAGKGGRAHLDIFNVVGEKVRSIDLGNASEDIYHYVAWDGKNDSGNNVASGVYVGLLKVGDHKKTWKMAVIK